MDIVYEIHTPGLDLHTSRWTHHLVFMQVVHADIENIQKLAREQYEQDGRGALHVSQAQWIDIVRDAVLPGPTPFPANDLPADRANETCDFGLVAPGYAALLSSYDPETQFMLTVEHHPEGLLSAYLIEPLKKTDSDAMMPITSRS